MPNLANPFSALLQRSGVPTHTWPEGATLKVTRLQAGDTEYDATRPKRMLENDKAYCTLYNRVAYCKVLVKRAQGNAARLEDAKAKLDKAVKACVARKTELNNALDS